MNEDNSVFLNILLWNKSKELKNIINIIYKKNNQKIKKGKFILMIILSNLLKLDKNQKLIISLNKNFYSNLKYVNYNSLIKIINFLKNNNYIIFNKGYFNQNNIINKRTEIYPSIYLKSLFSKYKIIDSDFLNISSLISIRDENKNEIKYKYTENLLRRKKILKKLNYILNKNDIKFNISKNILYQYYNYKNNEYKKNKKNKNRNYAIFLNSIKNKKISLLQKEYIKQRIFNNKNNNYKLNINFNLKNYISIYKNDENHGGRFYHHWVQQVPSSLRKYILINNNETVECDYSSLHPNIIMSIENIHLNNDIYIIPEFGKENRKAIKLIINVCLNAKTKKSALLAILNIIDNYFIQPNNKNYNSTDIINIIYKYYPWFKKYFFNEYGLILQNKESFLAECIIFYFIQKNIPILCIHDSFIVEKKYKQILKKIMLYVFKYFYKQDILIKEAFS